MGLKGIGSKLYVYTLYTNYNSNICDSQDGKYIYSCGGYDKAGSKDTATNHCWRLEVSLDKKDWQQITSMAEKRYGASASIIVRNIQPKLICELYFDLGWEIDCCWWEK